MGFEGLFFGRLDYNEKSKRASEKNLEMIWRASDDRKSELFTGVLPNGKFGKKLSLNYYKKEE